MTVASHDEVAAKFSDPLSLNASEIHNATITFHTSYHPTILLADRTCELSSICVGGYHVRLICLK